MYKVEDKRHGESSEFLSGLERVRESLLQEVAFEYSFMVPHSSTLAWKIRWTEKPGRL